MFIFCVQCRIIWTFRPIYNVNSSSFKLITDRLEYVPVALMVTEYDIRNLGTAYFNRFPPETKNLIFIKSLCPKNRSVETTPIKIENNMLPVPGSM